MVKRDKSGVVRGAGFTIPSSSSAPLWLSFSVICPPLSWLWNESHDDESRFFWTYRGVKVGTEQSHSSFARLEKRRVDSEQFARGKFLQWKIVIM
jgi:hypothetical protein